jgi:hypothetical protein
MGFSTEHAMNLGGQRYPELLIFFDGSTAHSTCLNRCSKDYRILELKITNF